MDIEICNVEFLPNGTIKVTFKRNGGDEESHDIPKNATLRKAMDAVLISKIKESLGLLP